MDVKQELVYCLANTGPYHSGRNEADPAYSTGYDPLNKFHLLATAH
ncbi:hypothetical protein Pla110_13550 [Polystyrenella longa]|uniref:Uncharacterized protein n=1 Tax=Polystyrenella longa TaxID=2528007 RepID=A0A518CKD6_9PLAN|nr:hypothetical protein Pla110_13550 [Polystyrenella longa]